MELMLLQAFLFLSQTGVLSGSSPVDGRRARVFYRLSGALSIEIERNLKRGRRAVVQELVLTNSRLESLASIPAT